MKLADAAKIVRSKNAGPFHLTIDILFDNRENYEKVRDSEVLTPELFSKLYSIPVNQVEVYEFDSVSAFKVTMPRHIASGSPGDSDIYGCQQHAPALEIDVPV